MQVEKCEIKRLIIISGDECLIYMRYWIPSVLLQTGCQQTGCQQTGCQQTGCQHKHVPRSSTYPCSRARRMNPLRRLKLRTVHPGFASNDSKAPPTISPRALPTPCSVRMYFMLANEQEQAPEMYDSIIRFVIY